MSAAGTHAPTEATGTFKGLKLTNTLTRKKEEFIPFSDDNVRMYVCGPTVYDFAHIGNARPVIVFDVLNRLLRYLYGADHVTYVRNITDVDDKINARALRDYPDLPLNDAIAKVTEKTADQFHKDVAALGCLEPDVEPRATQHIDGMISMIQTLIEKGHAYEAATEQGGEVLFDTASMPAYGGLSKRKLEDQKAGARIAVDSHKKNPGDFVLWKLSSPEEPGWDSPWGRGRPGWHIECSVMSEKHLGQTFDIHGGGLDLIFPHHENEIAQSCCAHGTDKMATYWLHNGFVQVEGRKMSKSEGNFVTIHDLLETEKFGGRKWPGEVLRLAMLMTHYREPIDFSVKRLEEAERVLHKWADVQMQINASFGSELGAHSITLSKGAGILDDLNTPVYITELHKLADEAKKGSRESSMSFSVALDLLGFEDLEYFSQSVANLEVYLEDDIAADIDARVSERLALLEAKDWSGADAIRDQLSSEGILLKDSKDSETGKRVTSWEVKR